MQNRTDVENLHQWEPNYKAAKFLSNTLRYSDNKNKQQKKIFAKSIKETGVIFS